MTPATFARLREWLSQTHGTRFELVRHFVPRFLDSDLVGASGDWLKVAGGLAALLASSWMLLGALLLYKYGIVAEQAPRLLQSERQADLGAITGLCVCVAMLLAAILWQAIFPSLRDFLALAGMPVSPADIFFAKFCALCSIYGLFALILVVPTACVYAVMAGGGLFTALAWMSGASTLVFFVLASLQGLSLNLLPVTWFERLMLWMQASIASLAIGGFALAMWKGHLLYSLLARFGHLLVPGAVLAIALAALAFVLSFHRYRRMILEAPPSRPSRGSGRIASRVMEWLFDNPQKQAAVQFILATASRNRVHRLAILVYAGLAVSWMAWTSIRLVSESAVMPEWSRAMYTVWPLALSLFTMLGLRHLFSLPADLKSNWMFRVSDREGRVDWLNAAARLVQCAAAAPLLVGALFTARLDGPLVAAAWLALAGLLSGTAFEVLFRHWRKMPFTCAYVPGKRTPLLNGILFFATMMTLTPVAYFVHASARNAAGFVILMAILLAAWTRQHKARMAHWGTEALQYEDDEAPSGLQSFGLAEDGGTFARERYHREWSNYLRHGDQAPLVRPLEAGETRLGRILEWVRATPADFRMALRSLRKNPGFAAAVIATLGLGLGLNAAFFAVFNGFLLEPLAVRDPSSLYSIEFTGKGLRGVHLNFEDYRQFAGGATAVAELCPSSLEGAGLDGHAAKIAAVGANYFSMLGVNPALGRVFGPGETGAVMVLAYRTWQNRFGGDPNIIGRKLQVDGVPFEVAGVAKAEFPGVNVGTVAVAPPELARYGVGAADVWIPFEASRQLTGFRDLPVLGVVARLKPGLPPERVRSEMQVLAKVITRDRADYERVSYASLDSLDIPITWTTLRYSVPLLLAFALTMLIPCANAANLMLARALSRQRELGVRLSLGASRGRLVRQSLTESLVLSLLASVVGVFLARLALDFMLRLVYATAPATLLYRARIPDFPIGSHLFVYMVAVSVAATALFALAPAAQATRAAVANSLRGELLGWRDSRLRDGLIAGQIGTCVMLLAVAFVMIRGSQKAEHVPRGFDVTGVYGVVNESPEDAHALERLLDGQPWVETLAYFGRPFQEMDTVAAADAAKPDGSLSDVYLHYSSGSFFDLVRLPVIQGRTFTVGEAATQAPVAIVSESAASRLWSGNPIGKTVLIRRGSNENARLPKFDRAVVIGVCRDVVARVRDGGPRPAIHLPDSVRRDTLIAVRGRSGNPHETQRLLEATLSRAPGAARGARVVEASEMQVWETYPQQMVAWLSSLLGVVALLLTVSGIYGVMSYLVSQRTKEIGIRMALGAARVQVARLILVHSTRLAALGIAVGCALAAGALQWVTSLVEMAVDVLDPGAYAATLLAIAAAGLIAVSAPVWRACRVDPQQVLRED